MPQFYAEASNGRTSITAGLIFAALLSARACRAANITWSSPSVGDVYGPGALILGEWLSDVPLQSPSFQLCAADTDGEDGDSDSCGASIQPALQQDPNSGSYQVTLTPSATPSSAPIAPSDSDEPASPSSSPEPHTLHNAAQPQSQPLTMEQTRMPAPTAAYAVPLALAGAVILFASALGIHQHRALVRERAAEKERLARTAGPTRAGFMQSRASSVHSLDMKEKDVNADAELGYGTGMAPKDDNYTRIYVPQLSGERRERLLALRHAHAQPRETTREPYTPTPVRSTVPAGLFKASHSPRVPHATPTHAPRAGSGRIPPDSRTQAQEDAADKAGEDDDAYDAISHYLQPSPVPPTPITPQPAHTRRSASLTPAVPRPPPETPGDLYEEVARRLPDRY
ncbi:hypothetical protein EIP86_011043 [Pleurotus ostreatoroseus]|nr:hypothetical protein EIP86_011043 [Pleurotus ostreatoroseus]